MNPNTLVPQILNRSDTLLYLWCVLIVVGLAVLVAAARAPHPSLAHLLFLGYAFFAITHLMCLQWILKQWAATVAALQKTTQWEAANFGPKEALSPVLDAPSIEWVLPFHLAFDLFVLFGLWWLSRKRGTPGG